MNGAEKIGRVRRYFELLTAARTGEIVALFEKDAVVSSPFLGNVNAPDFFEKLGSASQASVLTVFDVLLGEDQSSAAAYFEYDWTLRSGEQIVFQGIDYFRFSSNGLFSSMAIFYDTHPLREEVGDKYA